MCVNKNGDGSNWTADQCVLGKSFPDALECKCDSLSPATLVNDVDNVFGKVAAVFSAEGFSAFLNFPFYKSIIFYIFVVQTIALIIFIQYGKKSDQKKWLKVKNSNEDP